MYFPQSQLWAVGISDRSRLLCLNQESVTNRRLIPLVGSTALQVQEVMAGKIHAKVKLKWQNFNG